MSLLETADAGMIAEQVRTAHISSAEVAEHFLAHTHAREADIQAFVSLDPAALRTQVAQLKGPALNGLLAGVPVGVKDIIDTHGHPTCFYSPIYQGNQPSRHAHVVTLLRQAGALIMGKTHATEFANYADRANA